MKDPARAGLKCEIAASLLRSIRDCCEGQKRITGVEVGVKAGEMSEMLLAGEPRLFLYMVDRWQGADAESDYAKTGDVVANASDEAFAEWDRQAYEVRERYRGRSGRFVGEGKDAARFYSQIIFDFVYLDADHSYPGRRGELEDWFPLVRPGGLIAGGLWTSAHGGDCCARAVTEFVRGRDVEIEHGPFETWRFIKP